MITEYAYSVPMSKRIRIRVALLSISILCFLLFLSGCSKEEGMQISGVSFGVEVMYDDTHALNLQIPIECLLVQTDNHSYFAYNNDLTIYVMSSQDTSAKYDEETGIYISRTFLERDMSSNCVVVSVVDENLKEFMVKSLSEAEVVNISAETYVENRLKSLPEYEDKSGEMSLVGNIYMPPLHKRMELIPYEADLYTVDDNWLQCFIIDDKFDNIRTQLVSLTQINGNKDDTLLWYQSDEIFYGQSGRNIVAAKRLAYNCWYVYYGSTYMKDYILTGIHKIHG